MTQLLIKNLQNFAPRSWVWVGVGWTSLRRHIQTPGLQRSRGTDIAMRQSCGKQILMKIIMKLVITMTMTMVITRTLTLTTEYWNTLKRFYRLFDFYRKWHWHRQLKRQWQCKWHDWTLLKVCPPSDRRDDGDFFIDPLFTHFLLDITEYCWRFVNHLTEGIMEIFFIDPFLTQIFLNMTEHSWRFVHHLTEEMKEILRSSGVKLPLLAPIHHGQVIIVRKKTNVKSKS